MPKKKAKKNLPRPSGAGKFKNRAAALAYELSLEDDRAVLREGNASYTRLDGPFDLPELEVHAGAIVFKGGDGRVQVEWHETKEKLNSEWRRLEDEIYQEENPGFSY
jgi:hypothetical protein